MPQSARILSTVRPKPAVPLEDCQREYGRVTRFASPQKSRYTEQDYLSNEEVLERASLPSIESILLQLQLRWAGHVTNMEDVRMPKAVFFSKLKEGERDRGAPRKRYKDQLKRQHAQAGISHQSWQQEASGGDSWR